jgi:putative transposase
MRHSQSEKMEIIRIVENSKLNVKRTLDELCINRSTFYEWYRRYQELGYDGLANRSHAPKQFWNAIPPWEAEKVVEIALELPDKSPRELAWHITDTQEYYISESSVYRILKARDLITSPNYTVISAKDKYGKPTKRVHELWQTDFTYLKVVHWGWYYLTTIIDDYSRYIIDWELCGSMKTDDVTRLLDKTFDKLNISHVKVLHKPRLLSDNGPCYISEDLQEYLSKKNIKHIRCRPYHPQTQGKIERYHRSLKNLILLDHYYTPEELKLAIGSFVKHYNNYRYHESLDNVTPSDVYYNRHHKILSRRELIKEKTLKQRRKEYRKRREYEQKSKVKKGLVLTETVS